MSHLDFIGGVIHSELPRVMTSLFKLKRGTQLAHISAEFFIDKQLGYDIQGRIRSWDLPLREKESSWQSRFSILVSPECLHYLSVDIHDHNKTNSVHFILTLDPVPAGTPPPTITEITDKFGGAVSFMRLLSSGLEGATVQSDVRIVYNLSISKANKMRRQFQAKATFSGKGATFANSAVSWQISEHPVIKDFIIIYPSGKVGGYGVSVNANLEGNVSSDYFSKLHALVWAQLEPMIWPAK